jgi:hypothetical protein
METLLLRHGWILGRRTRQQFRLPNRLPKVLATFAVAFPNFKCRQSNAYIRVHCLQITLKEKVHVKNEC